MRGEVILNLSNTSDQDKIALYLSVSVPLRGEVILNGEKMTLRAIGQIHGFPSPCGVRSF